MSINSEPIRGKVASVLNDREVALNKGAIDGVNVGMVVKILFRTGADIRDPDSDELLGSVELEKTRVKVVSVQERISVASTFRTYKVNVGGTGVPFPTLSRVFEPPKWETRTETLRTDESIKEELREEESHVKTGDPFVQHIETMLVDES